MIDMVMTWLAQQNPAWFFMVFALPLGSVLIGMWREYRKEMKLEANPINMTNTEYKRFNNKRFSK